MRLIGGNISDTPVKEIGDGSAFNVGGAASSPDAVTLGAFGSATAITATNWSQCDTNVSTDWVKMSSTLLVNVTRKITSYELYIGGIDLTSAGEISTIQNAQDITSDFTVQARVTVMATRLTDTRIVVCVYKNTSPTGFEFQTYDYSGGTFTKHGTKLTYTPGTDHASQGFSSMIKVDADHVCLSHYGGSVNRNDAVLAKVTNTKNVGTALTDLGNGTGTGLLWLCGYAGEIFMGSFGKGYVRMTANTSTQALTVVDYTVPASSGTIFGARGTAVPGDGSQHNFTLATPTASGQVCAFNNQDHKGGLVWWDGYVLNSPSLYGGAPNPSFVGVVGDVATVNANMRNSGGVKIDETSPWMRTVMVIGNSTTGLAAVPMNINMETGAGVRGTQVRGTTITPHSATLESNFGVAYDPAWAHIWVFCQDTAAAPSYCKLPVTV